MKPPALYWFFVVVVSTLDLFFRCFLYYTLMALYLAGCSYLFEASFEGREWALRMGWIAVPFAAYASVRRAIVAHNRAVLKMTWREAIERFRRESEEEEEEEDKP